MSAFGLAGAFALPAVLTRVGVSRVVFGDGFDVRAPFESVNAFDPLEDFGAFEPDLLAAGRAGDRLAAARCCFGMQCWPASLAHDSSKRSPTGQATPAVLQEK